MNIISSGINWGFQAQDVLSNAVALFQSVAPFVLLGLSLVLVPRLISLIRHAVGGGGEDEDGYVTEDEEGNRWDWWVGEDDHVWYYKNQETGEVLRRSEAKERGIYV